MSLHSILCIALLFVRFACLFTHFFVSVYCFL
jgi:hypothetical protein